MTKHTAKAFAVVTLFIAIAFLGSAITSAQSSSTIYVDGNLSSNCTSGNYSIQNRNCTGSDGNAYRTVEQGVSSLRSGQTLSIREGYYTVSSMELSFSGAKTTIQGYPGETVTLYKHEIRRGIFKIKSGSNNLEIKDLYLTSRLYETVTGWEQYSGNIWRVPRTNYDRPTEMRFGETWSTNNGRPESSLSALNEPMSWAWQDGYLYIYSTVNPNTGYGSLGVNIIDDYDAVGIYGERGAEATITNVHFSFFSHGGLKGDTKWHLQYSTFENIGTDSHDHHIYSGAQFSDGNGSIYENNYFGTVAGWGLHLYTAPKNHIARNNLFDCGGEGEGGIIIAGSYNEIYNNTITNCNTGLMFFRTDSQYNEVYDNIMYANGADIAIDRKGGNSCPTNNIVYDNYLGSANTCRGCTDLTSIGCPNYTTFTQGGTNTISQENPFTSGSPLASTNPQSKSEFTSRTGSTSRSAAPGAPRVWTPAAVELSEGLLCGASDAGVQTAIGCLPFGNTEALTAVVLRWALGVAGGAALLSIGLASYRIITSQGDPRRLKAGQELLLAAIGGLVVVVLSVFILRFIGVDLLGLF